MKIGLIADNESVIKHDLELIKWLSNNPRIELSVLINQKIKNEGLWKLLKNFKLKKFIRLFGFKCLSKLDSITLFKLKKYLKEYNYNFKGLENISDYFNKTINIKPIISKSGYVYRYKEEDIDNLKNNNLDIIIRSCSGILRGDILKTSKFGIISFHHADNRVNRGAPPGFWEIINKSPETGFTIQILTNELDGGKVLKRGDFMTKSTFSLNQVFLYCKANYYMKQILIYILENNKLPDYLDSIPYSKPLYTIPTIRYQLRYVLYLMKYIVRNLLDSKVLKIDYRWNIHYSFINWERLTLWKSIKIENPIGRYYADPFIIKENGKYYIFVEDLANAFIAASLSTKSKGQIFNIGSGKGITFLDMVKTIIKIVGKGSFQNIPWPKDYINVETGNYITNITKAKNILEWKPEIDFEEGIKMTVEYYSKHISKYL